MGVPGGDAELVDEGDGAPEAVPLDEPDAVPVIEPLAVDEPEAVPDDELRLVDVNLADVDIEAEAEGVAVLVVEAAIHDTRITTPAASMPLASDLNTMSMFASVELRVEVGPTAPLPE